MECPKKRCHGAMRVTRSYTGKGFQIQERTCDDCGAVMNFHNRPAKEQGITPRALMLKIGRRR
jgi:hypothetical protein